MRKKASGGFERGFCASFDGWFGVSGKSCRWSGWWLNWDGALRWGRNYFHAKMGLRLKESEWRWIDVVELKLVSHEAAPTLVKILRDQVRYTG